MSLVTFAVTPKIAVGGPTFSARDLITIGEIVGSEARIELTTLQHLIVEMHEVEASEAIKKIKESGLCVYKTGAVVKNLSVCSFCKGAEIEGLDVAKKVDAAIAGIEVPFTMRVGYSGCPNACGEPLVKDIGVVKRGDFFEIYIGGQSKTLKASTGQLLVDRLSSEQLIETVLSIIERYKQEGKKNEKFHTFITRYGREKLLEELGL